MTFVTSGYKWGASVWGEGGGQVNWSVESLAGLPFDDALYSPSDFRTSLQDAFDLWESVGSIDFTYVADYTSADLTILSGGLAGPTVGEAWLSYSGLNEPGQILEANITFDLEQSWSPNGETALSFFAVALHEIGHVIGLGHTDADPAQIMYPSITSLNTLGEGDVNGAETIYGAYDANARTDDPRDWITDEPFGPETPGVGDGGGDGEGGGGGDASGIFALILGLLAILFLSTSAFFAAAGMTGPEEDEDGDDPDQPDGPDLGDVIPVTGQWDDTDTYEVTHAFYREGFDHDHDEDLLSLV